MAMQFIRRAQQLKILDAADETAAIINSPAYARFKPHFRAIAFDIDALARDLATSAAAGRATYTDRGSSQDSYESESSDVRQAVEDFTDWVSRLHAAARAIEVLDHPLSTKVSTAFKLGTFEGGSAENVYGNGPQLIRNIEALGDISHLGVPPSFVAEGKEILTRIPPERIDATNANVLASVTTTDLHLHLDRIVDLMERYERFREFAMAMSKQEIPSLGLAAIRSNLAGRSSTTPSATPDSPTL